VPSEHHPHIGRITGDLSLPLVIPHVAVIWPLKRSLWGCFHRRNSQFFWSAGLVTARGFCVILGVRHRPHHRPAPGTNRNGDTSTPWTIGRKRDNVHGTKGVSGPAPDAPGMWTRDSCRTRSVPRCTAADLISSLPHIPPPDRWRRNGDICVWCGFAGDTARGGAPSGLRGTVIPRNCPYLAPVYQNRPQMRLSGPLANNLLSVCFAVYQNRP